MSAILSAIAGPLLSAVTAIAGPIMAYFAGRASARSEGRAESVSATAATLEREQAAVAASPRDAATALEKGEF